MVMVSPKGRAHYSIKASTRTANISQPSILLLLSIFYPESYKAMSSACQYGCEHEDVAREKYIESYSRIHETFLCD